MVKHNKKINNDNKKIEGVAKPIVVEIEISAREK
jgi:hypothetical protein